MLNVASNWVRWLLETATRATFNSHGDFCFALMRILIGPNIAVNKINDNPKRLYSIFRWIIQVNFTIKYFSFIFLFTWISGIIRWIFLNCHLFCLFLNGQLVKDIAANTDTKSNITFILHFFFHEISLEMRATHSNENMFSPWRNSLCKIIKDNNH